MPDIAMCQNRQCPSAGECWRFNATPWEIGQDYSDFSVPEGEDKCSFFWPMPETEEERYRRNNDLKVSIQEWNEGGREAMMRKIREKKDGI